VPDQRLFLVLCSLFSHYCSLFTVHCSLFTAPLPYHGAMQPSANPEFLRRAIALATQNVLSGAGGPFGAVIVRDGRIVAEGVNTVTATNDPTAHAEVNAIRAAARLPPLHQLRTLPHVPGRGLLGACRGHILRRKRRRCRPRRL
jgi:hypothetical protein